MEIKRTPTKAEGGLTSEEKIKMDAIAKKWIDRAFFCGEMDKEKIITAIERLYMVAGLKKPRVVIVPSPLVASLAFNIASEFLKINSTSSATDDATDDATVDVTRMATYSATYRATRMATYNATVDATRMATDNATRMATVDATDSATYSATVDVTRMATSSATDDATRMATVDATVDATDSATRMATDSATYRATRMATDDATRMATVDATVDATDSATRMATDSATYRATRMATDDATRMATSSATDDATWYIDLAKYFLGKKYKNTMKNEVYSSYQSGNMWAGVLSYAEAMRDVLGLTDLSCWEKYQAWEDAGWYGGFRMMHENFCMVSEFPVFIKVNDKNEPHCIDGASHRWRDGWELYHMNGIVVPQWLACTSASQLTAKQFFSLENADVKAEFIKKVGIDKMVSYGKEIDSFVKYPHHIDYGFWSESEYKLIDMAEVLQGIEYAPHLYMKNLSVPGTYHLEGVSPECRTLKDAITWREGGTKVTRTIAIK